MLNVCFHGVGAAHREMEPGEAEYWVSPQLFGSVLDLVEGRDDVRLSFDDGNLSDVTHALPALLARGLKAEFYVLAGRLGRSGSLASSQVRELRDAGMTIGSHGMHHRSWRSVSEAEAVDEFARARAVIADTVGQDVDHAACPLGEYDRWVLRRLREEGFTQVMTSDRAVARRDQWLQPRYSIRAHDTVASVCAILERRTRLPQRLGARGRILAKSWR